MSGQASPLSEELGHGLPLSLGTWAYEGLTKNVVGGHISHHPWVVRVGKLSTGWPGSYRLHTRGM